MRYGRKGEKQIVSDTISSTRKSLSEEHSESPFPPNVLNDDYSQYSFVVCSSIGFLKKNNNIFQHFVSEIKPVCVLGPSVLCECWLICCGSSHTCVLTNGCIQIRSFAYSILFSKSSVVLVITVVIVVMIMKLHHL